MADDDELDVEVAPLPYPYVESDEQKLRCFIAQNYIDPEIDARILIENMEHIYNWICEGSVPTKNKAGPKLVKKE